MDTNIATLQKILQLEEAKGYNNLAVIGGLDRYLYYLLKQAKDNEAQLLPLKKLSLSNFSYATLNKSERREWVGKMLKLVDKVSLIEPTKPEVSLRHRTTSSYAPDTDHPLDSPITVLKGVSSTLAAKFARLGVKTVRDMLYFFPRRHLDYSQQRCVAELKVGLEQTIVATVWEAQQVTLGGRRSAEAIVGDETGNIRAVWFNQPYLAKSLRTNAQVAISGRVSLFKGRKVFESPEWEILDSGSPIHTGRLVPLYPLTSGLTPRLVRRLVKETVDRCAPQLPDFLPLGVRNHCHLLPLPQAIQQAHFPENKLQGEEARKRLAFDELFIIQLGMLSKRRDWQQGQQSNPMQVEAQILESFFSSLPFSLTPAQQRVLQEILSDLGKSRPMCRLLQGEVGSGKTVIATAALWVTVANGYQAVLMAPTEILAEQHFNNISSLLSKMWPLKQEQKHLHIYSLPLPSPFTLALLTGSISQAAKLKLHQHIKEGNIDLVIGTHALIQKGVEFRNLGLVVIDEQHRFGVMQRSALREKGRCPHVLVMTATPIPRTLALTIYGDLDLSVINQLPPGRKMIKTKWLNPEERGRAYDFVRCKVAEGRQAFIICPLIEESENIEARAAIIEYRFLSQQVFPDLHLGLLHGRMPTTEKEEVMRSFRVGGIDILVSTPVVEVGIDVPNATVMLIEGADRFGLSQLHQFRGRVGRGEFQSYCLLLAENPKAVGRERLTIIEQMQDGFALAEEDLRLRGPGEFFGTRQSGLPDLHMAKLSDVSLLERARKEAIHLFQHDPELKQPDSALLAAEMAWLWKDGAEYS
jgi:ATP-dependent DNA helicase RecG